MFVYGEGEYQIFRNIKLLTFVKKRNKKFNFPLSFE